MGADVSVATRASVEARTSRVEARKLTALDHAARVLEGHGAELAESILTAARKGDWRAVAFLYERVYGRPVERVADVSKRDVADLSAEERAELRRALLTEYPHLVRRDTA